MRTGRKSRWNHDIRMIYWMIFLLTGVIAELVFDGTRQSTWWAMVLLFCLELTSFLFEKQGNTAKITLFCFLSWFGFLLIYLIGLF